MAGRRRYIAVGNKWVEVDLDYAPEPSNQDSLLWNDRAYQDVGDPRFTSRSQHRDYMKQHGLTTYDDFKDTFKKAQEQRDEFYTRAPDPTRSQDVADAIQHTKRRK